MLKVKYFLKYSVVVLIAIIISGLYLNSKWNLPIDENESNTIVRRLKETKETIKAAYTGKFKKYTNLSTYAFLSNIYITQNIFRDKFIGTGIGSYKHEYDKYYPDLSPPNYLVTLKQSKINRTDANSLMLRMIADLGVFGLLLILYFAYRSFNIFRKDSQVIQQSIFFLPLCKVIKRRALFSARILFLFINFFKKYR